MSAKKAEEKTTRERMGFGHEPQMPMGMPIADVMEHYDTDSDQALKSARTLLEADDDNIDLRTDLSDHEIKCLTKIMYLQTLVNIPNINMLPVKFMRLKVSRNRKSRSEFVDTVKVKQEPSGLFSRWTGR